MLMLACMASRVSLAAATCAGGLGVTLLFMLRERWIDERYARVFRGRRR